METGLYADKAGHGEGAARAARARRSTPRTCWSSWPRPDAARPRGAQARPQDRPAGLERLPRAAGAGGAASRATCRTDVLVVGMGISGAMVAEALTAAGRAVMLIDRRGPILGSTAATHGAGAVRDRPAADAAGRQIGRERAERGLAAVAAGGRQPRGADRGARDPLRPGAAAVALPGRRPARRRRPARGGGARGGRRASHATFLDAGRAARGLRHRPGGGDRSATAISRSIRAS